MKTNKKPQNIQNRRFCLDAKETKISEQITPNWYLSSTDPLNCCLRHFMSYFSNMFFFIMVK